MVQRTMMLIMAGGVGQLGWLGAAVAGHGAQGALDGARASQPQPLPSAGPAALPQLPWRHQQLHLVCIHELAINGQIDE